MVCDTVMIGLKGLAFVFMYTSNQRAIDLVLSCDRCGEEELRGVMSEI